MSDSNNILTIREKNLCEYGAVLGVLLSLTCLVQHLLFAISNYITNPMIPAYIFAIAAFVCLGLIKPISIVLLIISATYSAIVEYLWITHYAFSLVVLLLFLYHTIIIVLLLTENIPKKLKMKKAAEKAEKDEWVDKI